MSKVFYVEEAIVCKAITDVLSSSIRDRLEELEHQDVYELIVNDLADRLEQDFDNFDVDKFIDAT